jgi:DNA-binding NarL/FixJ family response regulator
MLPKRIATTNVIIVGNLQLQNKLMATSLEKLGFNCSSCETLKTITECDTHNETVLSSSDQRYIVLLDCIEFSIKQLREQHGAICTLNSQKCYVTLYNIEHSMEIEDQALISNVHGIFYKNDSIEWMVKGLQAIITGELWFSRKVLSKHITHLNGNAAFSHKPEQDLTHREIEILKIIASGKSNNEIANHLCISPHTVRTHVANIYAKINVPNRVQATLCAAKFLE